MDRRYTFGGGGSDYDPSRPTSRVRTPTLGNYHPDQFKSKIGFVPDEEDQCQ